MEDVIPMYCIVVDGGFNRPLDVAGSYLIYENYRANIVIRSCIMRVNSMVLEKVMNSA